MFDEVILPTLTLLLPALATLGCGSFFEWLRAKINLDKAVSSINHTCDHDPAYREKVVGPDTELHVIGSGKAAKPEFWQYVMERAMQPLFLAVLFGLATCFKSHKYIILVVSWLVAILLVWLLHEVWGRHRWGRRWWYGLLLVALWLASAIGTAVLLIIGVAATSQTGKT